MKFRIVIPEGEIIPRWYGVAYRDFLRDATVCYPVPFNWLASWGRVLWYRIRFPRRLSKRDLVWHEGYAAGKASLRKQFDVQLDYLEGRVDALVAEKDAAYQRGWNEAFAHMERELIKPKLMMQELS